MNTLNSLILLCYVSLIISCTSQNKQSGKLNIEVTEVVSGSDSLYIWTQARAASIPTGNGNTALMTMSKTLRSGHDGYLGLYELTMPYGDKAWSEPTPIPSLKIHKIDSQYRRSMSDMTLQWHDKTGKVLNIGKSFFCSDDERPARTKREVAYAVYDPSKNTWGDYSVLALPTVDADSNLIISAVSGCAQYHINESGVVYVPISYDALPYSMIDSLDNEAFSVRNYKRRNNIGNSVTVVACSFDGEKLQYVDIGAPLTLKNGAGLGEPSIAKLADKWFITLRSSKTAFVATSNDGLHFENLKEWKFDTGEVLGSYNTQQHWAVVNQQLYLVYTRPDGNNDHIFRNRAPLYIARVDTENMVVVKSTEQVCVPEDGVALGNFGVTHVNDNESWVTTTEYLRKKSPGKTNRVWLAKVSNGE